MLPIALGGAAAAAGGGGGAAAGGLGGAFWGGVAGGALGGLGDVFGMSSAKDQAASSRELQLRFAQHGVQMRMNDLKRSGLNPILAVTGGGGLGAASGGGAPSTAQYQPRFGEHMAQMAMLASQTRLNTAAAAKADAEAGEAKGRTLSPGLSDDLARAQSGLSTSSAARADQEVQNLRTAVGEIEARTKQLTAEAERTGLSAELAQRVMETQVEMERVKLAIEKQRLDQQAFLAELSRKGTSGIPSVSKMVEGVGKFLGEEAARTEQHIGKLVDEVKRRFGIVRPKPKAPVKPEGKW